MPNLFQKKKRLYPIWVLLVTDLLALAIVLCTFSYFHHVRILWGKGATVMETDVIGSTYKQHDFSSRFPVGTFAAQGEEVCTDSVYRSRDIFMTLRTVEYPWYSASGEKQMKYYVYDFYIRHVENLYSSISSRRKPFEDLVEDSAKLSNADGIQFTDGACIAAVNDDYWGNANHTLVAVRNGIVLRQNDELESDICVLYYDGTMETYTPDTYDWAAIEARSPYQIWNFGPSLLDGEGNALTSFDSSSYDKHVVGNRNPRTAMGYYEPGHYCLVVVDGRSADADGATMAQLAGIMESLGCTAAYNMDGGGSTLAYYNEEMIRVVEGEETQRSLFGIICVGEIR